MGGKATRQRVRGESVNRARRRNIFKSQLTDADCVNQKGKSPKAIPFIVYQSTSPTLSIINLKHLIMGNVECCGIQNVALVNH